tara:strand:+ start:26018 stop:26125 length:108 start_codon:yes stop_codon:yes gene_type:complete
MFKEIIFRIKFWFKMRKLKKLDPFIYEVPVNDKKN